MKKSCLVTLATLLIFSLISTLAMASVCMVIFGTEFQIKDQTLILTTERKDREPLIFTFSVEDNQITVVSKDKETGLWEISVHVKGSTWYDVTHTLYLVSGQKLKTLETSILVDWKK